MTDLTTVQLATVLSALDGRRRKPASTDAALKAIARIAAALGRSTEAVLAAAPSLLDGRLDAAAWRDQLTATVRASKGERIAAGLRLAFRELPECLEIVANGEHAEVVNQGSNSSVLTAESDDAPTHVRRCRAVGKNVRQNDTGNVATGEQPVPIRPSAADPAGAKGHGDPGAAAAVSLHKRTRRALIVALLGREAGATTLDELIAATNWLLHTTRAALTGLRQKGCTLEKNTRRDSKTAYRVLASAQALVDHAAQHEVA